MVEIGRLFLFPLDEIEESFRFLARKFPGVFRDIRVGRENVSMRDQVVPDGFRDIVLPYVQDDLRLLELSRRTMGANA